MYRYIDQLNCSLNATGTYHLLGTSTEQTADQSNFEVVNLSDSLSNYKAIKIVVLHRTLLAIYNTFELPMVLFKTIDTEYACTMGSSYDAQIKYKDDNSIYIRQARISTAEASCVVQIYGVK